MADMVCEIQEISLVPDSWRAKNEAGKKSLAASLTTMLDVRLANSPIIQASMVRFKFMDHGNCRDVYEHKDLILKLHPVPHDPQWDSIAAELKVLQGPMRNHTIDVYAASTLHITDKAFRVCLQEKARPLSTILKGMADARTRLTKFFAEDVMLLLTKAASMFLVLAQAGIEVKDTGPHNLAFCGNLEFHRPDPAGRVVFLDWENNTERVPSRKSINAAFLQLIGGTGEALSHNSQAAFFASALRCHAWDKWWVQMSDSDIFSSSFEQWLVPGFHRLGRTLMELASIPLDDEAPSKTLPPPPPPLPPPPSKRTRAAAEAALTETLRN